MLICLCTAGAVSAAVLLQVDDIINIIEAEGRAPIEIPEIDREDVGKAQTLMILGSDRATATRTRASSRARTRSSSSGWTRTRR